MVRFLKVLKGNPKIALLTDPLWTAPFNMFQPFVALYMLSLGLGDIEIGTLLSVGIFVQFVTALISGVVTDKFGRRKTLLVSDFVAWNIPVLIWAFAQNFWWFFMATIINSVYRISSLSFECIWLEDTNEDKLPKLINWFQIFSLVSIFFVLISGFLVDRYTVVPAMRLLYLFAFVVMGLRILILYFFIKETKVGQERIIATVDKSVFQLLSGYRDVFLLIIHSKSMLRILMLLPLVGIFQMITGTFFALYATQNLLLGAYVLAYFPVVRAGVALLFFFLIQTRIEHFNPRHLMCVGIVLYAVSHGLLLVAPPQNIVWLGAYTLMDAWASALFLPRLSNLIFSSIDANERARCRALINVIVLAITIPFGFLAGLMSDVDRRLPFILNIVIFVYLIFFIFTKKSKL